MAWLYGQVWFAYLAAFAVGVALSWLLLVLPAQRRLRAAPARRPPGRDPAPAARPVAAAAPGRVDAAETVRLPAVDPALSTLDHNRGAAGVVAAGVAALGAAGVAGHRPGTSAGTGADTGIHADADADAGTETALIPVVASGPAAVPGAFPGSARPLPDGAAPTPRHTVKGSARSMLYHTPASPHFGRTIAEVWFTSARDAEAAGFADARRRRG